MLSTEGLQRWFRPTNHHRPRPRWMTTTERLLCGCQRLALVASGDDQAAVVAYFRCADFELRAALNRHIRIIGSGQVVGEVDHASHKAGCFRWRIAPVLLEHSSGGKDRTIPRIELPIVSRGRGRGRGFKEPGRRSHPPTNPRPLILESSPGPMGSAGLGVARLHSIAGRHRGCWYSAPASRKPEPVWIQ